METICNLMKVGKVFGVVDGAGNVLETRAYRDHAGEALICLMFGLTPPAEDKQIRRDGLPLILPRGTTTLVSEVGRVPVLTFSDREQARLWLRAYRKLCDRYQRALDQSGHRFRIHLAIQPVYRWSVFVDDQWEASFRVKVHAQEYALERAKS